MLRIVCCCPSLTLPSLLCTSSKNPSHSQVCLNWLDSFRVFFVAQAPNSFWLWWSIGVGVGGSLSPTVSPVPALAFSEAVWPSCPPVVRPWGLLCWALAWLHYRAWKAGPERPRLAVLFILRHTDTFCFLKITPKTVDHLFPWFLNFWCALHWHPTSEGLLFLDLEQTLEIDGGRLETLCVFLKTGLFLNSNQELPLSLSPGLLSTL